MPNAPRVACVAALAFAVLLPAAAGAATRISAAALRQDLALLRRAIVEAHASPYLYATPPAIARVFDARAATLRDTTAIGFYAVVSGLLAKLHDGHTRSLPSERWMAWYQESARVFPRRVRVSAGRIWIADSTDTTLAAGSELLLLNGRRAHDLVAEMQRKLPGDGFIETGKGFELGTRFAFCYYVLERHPRAFRVVARRPSGDTTSLELPAIAPSALPPDPGGGRPPLELSLRGDSLALLRIATFSADELDAAHLDYAAFMDSAFAHIAAVHARDLLIDLRGNDGGRDVFGSRLLSYLVSRPFAYYRELDARTRRVSFWRHTNVDSTFNASFGEGLAPAPGGGYRLARSRHPNLAGQAPRSPGFGGRVWVLTDGGTFSTAAEFCAIARSLGRAMFLGEETGGTYEGNSSGTFVILTLPHSGVRVVIPLVRYHLAVRAPLRPGRGILPDFEIRAAPPLGDAAVLQAALAHIWAPRIGH